MTKKHIIYGFLVYFMISAFTYGTLLGWWKGEFCEVERQEGAGLMLFAIQPPIWVVAPFLSGFWEHGLWWTWTDGKIAGCTDFMGRTH